MGTVIGLLLMLALFALLRGVIDVNAEHMVTLSQLARRLPARREDRPVNSSTVHRWRRPGLRGVKLECVRIGGIWHTSLEAYQRWVERLTTAAELGTARPPAATPVIDAGISSDRDPQIGEPAGTDRPNSEEA